MKKKTIFCLIGGSGSGKSSILNEMKKTYEDFLELISHCANRPIRSGEIDGVSYNFVDPAEFSRMRDNDELAEYAEYAGGSYGLSRKAIFDTFELTDTAAFICDANGFNDIKIFSRSYGYEVISINIRAPLTTLKARMKKRGETAETIEKRLTKAKEELKMTGFDYVINNNKKLEDAVKQFEKIFLEVLK